MNQVNSGPDQSGMEIVLYVFICLSYIITKSKIMGVKALFTVATELWKSFDTRSLTYLTVGVCLHWYELYSPSKA